MLSHVAILVPSVKYAAETLAGHGFHIGQAEEWEGEGTLEIYVGDPSLTGRLLLMEPVKEGAYTRAMAKRGPGLHHVAVDVLDLESFVDALAGTGWYLHPRSLRTIRRTQTAYLARPGTAMLIEVQQKEKIEAVDSFITTIEVPVSEQERKMIDALGVGRFAWSRTSEVRLIVGTVPIRVDDLIGQT